MTATKKTNIKETYPNTPRKITKMLNNSMILKNNVRSGEEKLYRDLSSDF